MRSKDAGSAGSVSVVVSVSADAPPPARGRVAARVARATRRARARPGITIVARASTACPIAVDAIPSRQPRAEPRGRQWRAIEPRRCRLTAREWAQLCARDNLAPRAIREIPRAIAPRFARPALDRGSRSALDRCRLTDNSSINARSKARTIAVRPSQRPDILWASSTAVAIDRGDSNPETLRLGRTRRPRKKYLLRGNLDDVQVADCVPYGRISTRIKTAVNRRSSSQTAR